MESSFHGLSAECSPTAQLPVVFLQPQSTNLPSTSKSELAIKTQSFYSSALSTPPLASYTLTSQSTASPYNPLTLQPTSPKPQIKYSIESLLSLRETNTACLSRQVKRRIYYLQIKRPSHPLPFVVTPSLLQTSCKTAYGSPLSRVDFKKAVCSFDATTTNLSVCRCTQAIFTICLFETALQLLLVTISAIRVCLHVSRNAQSIESKNGMNRYYYDMIPPKPKHNYKPFWSNKSGQTKETQNAHTYFNKNKMHNHREIKTTPCALMNVRSLCNKAASNAEFIVSKSIALLFLTETWLKNEADYDNAVLSDACPSDYKFLSFPRSNNKKGGGLAVIYHQSISARQLQLHQEFLSFEIALVQITISGRSIMFALIYRPPQSNTNQFLTELDQLCTVLTPYTDVAILGDFNLNMGSLDALDTFLSGVLIGHNLTQLVKFTTHDRGGILDLIITRASSEVFNNIGSDTGLADHLAITFQLNAAKPINKQSSGTTRYFKKINQQSFQEDLTTMVVSPILNCLRLAPTRVQYADNISIDYLANSYDQNVRAALDIHAPLKARQPSKHAPIPWWNSEILVAKRELRRAEKLWRQNKLDASHKDFLLKKRRLQSIISKAKKTYWAEQLLADPINSKPSWNRIQLLLRGRRNKILPSHSTYETLAAKMNEFLVSKPQNLRKSLIILHPTILLQPPTLPELPEQSTLGCSTTLDEFSPATENEVLAIIRHSPSKSCPSDPLPTWLLVQNIKTLLPAIVSLVNSAITLGFPTSWKTSLITPILKRPGLDPEDYNNYRPIANLPYISKLTERLVARRLCDFLMKNGILDPKQSAYRCNFSCETALTYVCDYTRAAMDNGRVTILVLLDLSAAFDCVDHRLLLAQLKSIGVHGNALNWFSLYLSQRQQSVLLDSTISPPLPLNMGVPQGSVLGPILFSIYLLGINKIMTESQIDYVIYADDIQIFSSASPDDLQQTLQRIEQCVSNIRLWLASKRLILNEKKSEFIILGQPRALDKCSTDSLTIAQCKIITSSKVKSLGVLLDQSLTMECQVNKIRSAAFYQLRLISRIRRSLNNHLTLLLVRAFVLSHLDFCATLLIGMSSKPAAKLQTLINGAIRLIFCLKKRANVTSHCQQIAVLPIHKHIEYRVLCLLHSILTSKEPDYLYSKFSMYEPTRSLRSSNQHLLAVPKTLTKHGDNCFYVFAAKKWNSLPNSLRCIVNHSNFIASLKEHLLSCDFA